MFGNNSYCPPVASCGSASSTFLGLGENLTRMSEDNKVLARWGKHREPDIDHTDQKIQDGINHGTEIRQRIKSAISG